MARPFCLYPLPFPPLARHNTANVSLRRGRLKLVSTFALALAMTVASATGASAADETPVAGIPGPEQDPYIWLEQARSPEALEWVAKENERTLAAFEADPRFQQLKAEALAIFDSEDRIPFVSIRPDGLYNFWQDKANPKGLLRRTTLESYRTDKPVWETVLDVDALAKAEGKEWVYQGSTCLPPALDKCMIALSDGGEDATIMREFDMTTKQFVAGGFVLESKSQGGIDWIDADTLMVNRGFGEGTLTESNYPFTSRVWERGTVVADAKEIYRGEPTDVWASASLLRDNAGTIHARMAFRGLSFHERAFFIEKDGKWLQLDIPKKASPFGIVDGHLLYSTDEDWTVEGQTFPADSLIAVDLAEWKANPNGAKKTLVWAPGERQTKQGGAVTGNALFVTLLDNVVGKVLQFNFESGPNGGAWVSKPVPLPDKATLGIAASSDETDQIMYTVTGFLEPTTLYYTDGSAAPAVLKTSPAYFAPDGMEVEQHEATSKDGTKIPYFIVKPKGMKLDGTAATLLTGYGGFQVPRLPGYLGSTGKLWVEKGGAYVLANLAAGASSGRTGTRPQSARTSSARGTISSPWARIW